jgi:hypothetical protein
MVVPLLVNNGTGDDNPKVVSLSSSSRPVLFEFCGCLKKQLFYTLAHCRLDCGMNRGVTPLADSEVVIRYHLQSSVAAGLELKPGAYQSFVAKITGWGKFLVFHLHHLFSGY